MSEREFSELIARLKTLNKQQINLLNKEVGRLKEPKCDTLSDEELDFILGVFAR